MSICRRMSLVVVGLAVAVPTTAPAQNGDARRPSGLGIGAVVTDARHPLLGDPLVGASARFSIPLGSRGYRAHFSAERLTGSAARMGNFCFGFVPPDGIGCDDEPLRDDARLFALGGGIEIEILDRARLSLDLLGDLGLAWVRVDTRGTTSTGEHPSSNQLWSGMAGLEASWSPSIRLPVALEAGISAGFLAPIFAEQVLDGYAPFEYEFGFTRMRLGAAWQSMRW